VISSKDFPCHFHRAENHLAKPAFDRRTVTEIYDICVALLGGWGPPLSPVSQAHLPQSVTVLWRMSCHPVGSGWCWRRSSRRKGSSETV